MNITWLQFQTEKWKKNYYISETVEIVNTDRIFNDVKELLLIVQVGVVFFDSLFIF